MIVVIPDGLTTNVAPNHSCLFSVFTVRAIATPVPKSPTDRKAILRIGSFIFAVTYAINPIMYIKGTKELATAWTLWARVILHLCSLSTGGTSRLIRSIAPAVARHGIICSTDNLDRAIINGHIERGSNMPK